MQAAMVFGRIYSSSS